MGVAASVAFVVIMVPALAWYARPVARSARDSLARSYQRALLPQAVEYRQVAAAAKTSHNVSANALPAPSVQEPKAPPAASARASTAPKETSAPAAPAAPVAPAVIPASFNLHIPFTPQAPHANWDLPFQETCEEASVFMARAFIMGDSRAVIDKDEASDALLDLVRWQKDRFGYYEDTTAAETALMAAEYYGLRYRILENPTVLDIKKEISAGHPVVVPAHGKSLFNPYFRNGGPVYHMLLIKGYTPTHFITNDPGTRRGADFTYPYNVLMNATHDLNKGKVLEGARRVIVVDGLVL